MNTNNCSQTERKQRNTESTKYVKKKELEEQTILQNSQRKKEKRQEREKERP